MIANQDIRKSIKSSNVYMYQIADALGIHENTLYRLLRKELSQSQKLQVLNVLKEIKKVSSMNFNFELPDDALITTRSDLKKLLQEVLEEVRGEDSKEEIMTVQEMAEYLKVSVPTVRSFMANKEFPFFQKGQLIRFYRKDVEDWIRRNSKRDGY